MTDLETGLRELVRAIVREEVTAALAEVKASHASHADERAMGGPTTEYIDDRALAAWLGMSRETLQQWRVRGDGPPHIKVAARALRYHVPSVRAWLATQTRG